MACGLLHRLTSPRMITPARDLPSATYLLVFLLPLLLIGCSLFVEPEPPEPYFQWGDYGGDPLRGSESLFNLRLSPDGRHIAFVRTYTPGHPEEPRYQLWIAERDGSNPRLIAVNVLTVDWSPDGSRLAVTVVSGIDMFLYTINLATDEVTRWTGLPDQRLSGGTAGNPQWFRDGKRLLVSVWGKDRNQPFERGLYIIDTEAGTTTGPLVEVMEGAFPGNGDAYATGIKWTYDRDWRDGNAALFDFAAGTWKWITTFTHAELDHIQAPIPSPVGTTLAQSRRVENAWQLFLMESDGTDVRQITEMGGDNPRWSYDGRWIFFRRDIHRGPGARFVPFVYDVGRGEERPVWPSRPDSLPVFPDLATQARTGGAKPLGMP